jgi:hypothetical protein
MTNEKFELEVKLGDQKMFEWMKKREYFFNMSFQFKKKLMQSQYLKHWFGKDDKTS